MQIDNTESSEKLVAQLSDTTILNTYSLVLSATNITHRIEYLSPNEIALYVSEYQAEKALYELAAYENENLNWPAIQQIDTFAPTFKLMSLIVIGCLTSLYYQTGQWSEKSTWFQKGAGNSETILENFELYRLVTSLSLHADHVHLLGNCILGGVVLHFFFQLVGNGIGLTMLTVTATVATYINVLIHGPGHHFVGFSTAVFAVIGMLCTIRFADRSARTAYHFIMPIMAGLALLAFLGSSGTRTDLGAHLFGLLCGLLGGNLVLAPHFKVWRNSFLLQTFLSILPFVLFYYCWRLALNA